MLIQKTQIPAVFGFLFLVRTDLKFVHTFEGIRQTSDRLPDP